MLQRFFALLCLCLSASALAQPIVLYTSVDEPIVRPLIDRFERQTGLQVKLVTDSEASKTSGLVAKLEAEKTHPRADVYWGNEISYTLNLAAAGVFASYDSPAAADIPLKWRGRDNLYTCVGLRARWLIFSTRPEAAPLVAKVKHLADLADPALKGKVGFCHPAFGTASGHVAALYTRMGVQRFSSLLHNLRANDLKLLGGNSVVAEQVAAGTLLAGVTDNDDVQNARAEGLKVDGLPLEGEESLAIPTTVALVAGGPNTADGKRLIDFLVTEAVEKELIHARYTALSVRDPRPRQQDMPADYEKAAANLRTAVETALKILTDR